MLTSNWIAEQAIHDKVGDHFFRRIVVDRSSTYDCMAQSRFVKYTGVRDAAESPGIFNRTTQRGEERLDDRFRDDACFDVIRIGA